MQTCSVTLISCFYLKQVFKKYLSSRHHFCFHITFTLCFPLCFFSQPQNILLTSLSPPGDIKIVDFGLARRLGAVGELREILGTPEYVGKVKYVKFDLITQRTGDTISTTTVMFGTVKSEGTEM